MHKWPISTKNSPVSIEDTDDSATIKTHNAHACVTYHAENETKLSMVTNAGGNPTKSQMRIRIKMSAL